MARYRISRRAKRDLDDIWLFIARDNQAAANALMDRLSSVFKMIASQRRIGRTRPDIGAKLRSFPVDDVVVFYEIVNPGVRIVRVWDARRDPAKFVE